MINRTWQNKTALVTGASQSIGLACARELAQTGATVVIMGRRREALEAARQNIMDTLPQARIETFSGDACDEQQVKAALAFAAGLNGRLDILVPTVGGAHMQPLLLRDVESVQQEFQVNFISTFLMVRHGVPLLQRGGSIVCISSISVTQSLWGMGIYGAAKAALERFVKAAAYELGGAGIRINAVRPGMTAELTEEQASNPEGIYADYVKETPLGRIGHPDDIARVVRFLAGDDADWVTGQTFSVDGGQEQGKGPDHMDLFFGKEVMDSIRAGQSVELDTSKPSHRSTSLRPAGDTSENP